MVCVCVCEVESVCVCVCVLPAGPGPGGGGREVWGWVGAFVSARVKEIITLAINVLALPPSLPPLLVLRGRVVTGRPRWEGFQERQVLMPSPGGGLPSRHIRARSAFSPLLHLLPPFLHPPSAESRVPAADASLSKQNEQYLTFSRTLLSAENSPDQVRRRIINFFSLREQMSQWGDRTVNVSIHCAS